MTNEQWLISFKEIVFKGFRNVHKDNNKNKLTLLAVVWK